MVRNMSSTDYCPHACFGGGGGGGGGGGVRFIAYQVVGSYPGNSVLTITVNSPM